jgi:predicted transcriptional regulator
MRSDHDEGSHQTTEGDAMLETLFSSRVRVKLLEVFLTNPGQRYHSRELARITGERQNSVWRELQKLEEAGLLRSETHGKRKDYVCSKESPLYAELRRLMLKATGAQERHRSLTPDIHERYAMPRCVIACRPDYVVGEND